MGIKLLRVAAGLGALLLVAPAYLLATQAAGVLTASGFLASAVGVELWLLAAFLASRSRADLLEAFVVTAGGFGIALAAVANLTEAGSWQEGSYAWGLLFLVVANMCVYVRFVRRKDGDEGWWPTARRE